MIQNVPSTNPGFFLDVIRIQNMQDGRVSVPVNPAHAVYARFKHVHGVPSRDGGAPLFRLRVLDNLIDRLLEYSEQVFAVPISLGNVDLTREENWNLPGVIAADRGTVAQALSA